MPRHATPGALSAQEHAMLAADVAAEGGNLPLARHDVHSRAVLKLMRERSREWRAAPPGPDAVRLPEQQGPLARVEVIPGLISVPEHDEDWGAVPLAKRGIHRALRLLPLVDDDDAWSSHGEAIQCIRRELGAIEPLPNVSWSDVTSDRAMSLVAFQGLGAHRLEQTSSHGAGVSYVVDLSWMAGYAVRSGFERYGACAYFADNRDLLQIYTSVDDTVHTPASPAWEMAKWRWKCSLFAATTVADHLGAVHLLVANLMVTATRESLPADHPVRRLLKPFEFRTVAVNFDASLSLAPENGLAHRAFAFEHEGLVGCLLHALQSTRFETFPASIARRGLSALAGSCPYVLDGLDLYACIRDYVSDYVTLFFPDDAAVRDQHIRGWWQRIVSLGPSLGLPPLTHTEQLIDVVTQFIFTVTAGHEQVGSVAEYVLDPAFISGKIRPGRIIADVQSSVQMLLLLAATGFKQPPLIGNYSHLLLDQHYARALTITARFQMSLKSLAATIANRNQHRAQPFETFNPLLLQSSVSI